MEEDIYTAACEIVETFAAIGSVPVSYPGVTFPLPQAGTWYELKYFPNNNRNVGLADDDSTQHIGLIQVAVCRRIGAGVVGMLATADTIANTVFPKGAIVGPVRVYEKPTVSSIQEMPDRVVVVVTIRYEGFDS